MINGLEKSDTASWLHPLAPAVSLAGQKRDIALEAASFPVISASRARVSALEYELIIKGGAPWPVTLGMSPREVPLFGKRGRPTTRDSVETDGEVYRDPCWAGSGDRLWGNEGHGDLGKVMRGR